MSTIERRSLERTRYRKSQSLRNRDLRDQLRNEAHLRWWHNRAIHRAYGVFEGFLLEPLTSGLLRVHPGKAYDAYGREIMLTRPQVIPVPESQQGMVLIIRYQEPDTGCGGSDPSSCLPGYRPVEETGVEFLWMPVEEVSYRDGVLLIQWVTDALGEGSPMEHPYTSRPYARPRMAVGATLPETTAWELWLGPESNYTEMVVGFQTVVDISQGGFITAPCVFAWLGGPVWEEVEKTIPNGTIPEFFTHVESVTPTQFTFRLILLQPIILRLRSAAVAPRSHFNPADLGWYVNWLSIGFEVCPPQPRKSKMRIHV